MSYTITKTAINSMTLTTGGVSGLSFKTTKINPLTLVEEVDNIVPPSTVEYTTVNDYIVITNFTTAHTIPISFDNDGVYFLYVTDASVVANSITKHILINNKVVFDYLTSGALSYICCCPSRDCRYDVLAHNDYVYNVVSNMCFSYLGYELEDISFNYGTIQGDATERSVLVSGIEYEPVSTTTTSTPDWRDANSVLLLRRKDGTSFAYNSTLVAGAIYTCIQTGRPTSYSGTTLTAYTSELIAKLKDIAEILYRVNTYIIANTTPTVIC